MNQPMSETASQQAPGPTKTRGGFWLGKAWDWLVEDIGVYLLLGLLAAFALTISQGLLFGPVAALMAAAGLRRAHGVSESEPEGENWSQRLQADFQSAFSCFFPSLVAGLLILLFSFLGLIFFLVPGLVIFSMYLFTFHFILDDGEDFWTAMESSRKLVARDYLGFSLFTLVLLGINCLGVLFLGIGIILTLMLTSLAVTVAYRDFTGGAPEPEPLPAGPIVIE